MLARNYVAAHAYSFDTVTPDQRYKDWLAVNDRIIIEAAAIPVDSFKIDVPEPTEAELTKFFDEHKNRDPQPDLIGQTEYPSPTPGFRIPRKVDVQYIQAEYDQLLANAENEVTDEEIAKYYDENKDLFIKADSGLIDDSPENQQTDSADEAATEPGADAPAPENNSEATEPGAAEDSNSQTSPGELNEPAAEENPTPQTPPSTEGAPADGDQSSRTGRSLFRLAAFLQEAQSLDATGDDAAESAPATETPAANDSTAAEGAESASNTTDSAATESPASTTPATPGTDAAAASPPAVDEPKQYQPLEEVRDLIRRELAGQKVNEQLSGLMNEIQTQLNGEFNKYLSAKFDAEAKQQKQPTPPEALVDLAPLAEKYKLKHGKTGPMSWLDLRKTPVGASGDIDRQSELYRILFGSEELDLYEPIITQDVDGNRYLAMAISDTPGRVPELAEVRKEVVDAWKRQKAADIALKHAEELAKKAQDSKSPLPEFFAGDQSMEVIRTDPFSRYTGGEIGIVEGEYQQQPFRLSEPDGIVAAGPEFMDKVFALKDGEVGAALNHDKSLAYVVRIAEHQLPEDELRTTYLAEANTWPGGNIMTRGHAQTAARLLVADILTSKNLKWERTADQMQEDEEEEE
jgi:hypothetical protein